MASAGDVNKDGVSDIVVGANMYDHPEVDEGAAFVYHGEKEDELLYVPVVMGK